MNFSLWYHQAIILANEWLRKRATYFTFHILYFILLGLFGGILAYVIEGDTDFLDCLFMAYSSCTLTGLASIDIQDWNMGSLWVLLVMMTMGNQVLLSAVPVTIRRYHYKRAFKASQDRVSKEEMEENVEYQALQSMQRITLCFYATVILLFFTILGPYCTYAQAELFAEHDASPVWFAWFVTNSAWCNCGFTIFSDNLVAFQGDYCILLCVSFLILLGNTMYPVALRFVVYVLHRIFPDYEGYKFLLKHPRRCCTHLFKSIHTKMLLACVTVFTVTEYIAYMAFEFNAAVMSGLSPHLRSLNSWFQAVSTRTGGFNSIDVAALDPAVLLLLAIMMYVASYPVIAALRQASEEERTVVAWDAKVKVPDTVAETLDVRKSSPSFAHEVKERCMGDLWMLGLALFIIVAIEGSHIQAGEFSTFSVIFEVFSAYGTVGLSMGYPGAVTSLSGAFNPWSKAVIIIVMIAGRHRGQPRSIDRAVNLESMTGDAEYALNPGPESPQDALDDEEPSDACDGELMHVSFAAPNIQEKSVFFKLPENDAGPLPEPYVVNEATSSSRMTHIPNPLYRDLNKFYTGRSSIMTFSGPSDHYRPMSPDVEPRQRMKSL